MDDFERELRQAFERRPAPPGLKRKLMEKRRAQRPPLAFITWQRLAASILLTAALAGGIQWHHVQNVQNIQNIEERRQQEAARQQVFTALRITSHALNQVNRRLAAHHRAAQD